MDVFPAVALALVIPYLALLLAFRIGLARLSRGENTNTPSVAIIIPAHNEADHIEACLAALARQTYPQNQIQILVVDDRSSDGTADRAASWSSRIPNLQILSSPNGPHRCLKKNALEAGIRASQSDLIFTTDADCRPPQTWVASTVSCFEPGIGLVAGYAPLLPGTNRLSNLLSLQALVVSALAAGSFGIGFPLSCSGRNLAYRRTAFTDAGGFAPIGHIRGGDDVLLMRQIASHTPWNLRFNPDANAGVPSAVHEDSLFHRHVRYQSKAIHYGIRVLILAGTVYIFHLTLAGAILAAWLHPEARPFAALLWALKILADIGFLWKAASLFKARPTLKWFPLLELIAVPYVVLFSALGTLKPSRWK